MSVSLLVRKPGKRIFFLDLRKGLNVLKVLSKPECSIYPDTMSQYVEKGKGFLRSFPFERDSGFQEIMLVVELTCFGS